MSEAMASTLDISFDVRGGLLIRQIHHMAALFFVAAIAIHLLRVFFTGAFRKPRELNWVIGVVLFLLSIAAGFSGYSLPDDLLSGTGLRITQGIIQASPVIGTWFSFLLFDGEFPGTAFIPRLYSVHILLIPGLILALVTAHLMMVWYQKHTQFPGPGRTNDNVVGYPLMPVYMAKAGGFFFVVFGTIVPLAGLFQINPIWAYGPYIPDQVTAGSQPDWYVGFLDGALRLMPPWEIVAFGHTLSLNLIIPAMVLAPLLLVLVAVYPWIEKYATGDDNREHHLLDRPRNAPTRTALGAAMLTFYIVLMIGGGNDIIAYNFDLSFNTMIRVLQVLLFVGPVVAFIVTKRMCLCAAAPGPRPAAARSRDRSGAAPAQWRVPRDPRAGGRGVPRQDPVEDRHRAPGAARGRRRERCGASGWAQAEAPVALVALLLRRQRAPAHRRGARRGAGPHRPRAARCGRVRLRGGGRDRRAPALIGTGPAGLPAYLTRPRTGSRRSTSKASRREAAPRTGRARGGSVVVDQSHAGGEQPAGQDLGLLRQGG